MIIRLYIPQPLAPGNTLTPEPGQQHYLSAVLRRKEGDTVQVFNGQQGEWKTTLRLNRRTILLDVQEQIAPQRQSPDIGLLFAPVKKAPLDFMIQKATELGARWIQPVRTQRTIVSRINADRLEANSIEAAEQTGRTDLPNILPFADLDTALTTLPSNTHLLFCDETRQAVSICQALTERNTHWQDPWAILIGPEGGFTPQEASVIRRHTGCIPVHLGERLLRADTAALAALAVWQAIVRQQYCSPPQKTGKQQRQ